MSEECVCVCHSFEELVNAIELGRSTAIIFEFPACFWPRPDEDKKLAEVITKSLALNVNLVKLDIRSFICCYTNESIIAIAKVLKINKTLTRLYLCPYGPISALLILESLKMNNHLTKVRLVGSCVDILELDVVIEILKTNKTLTLLGLPWREFYWFKQSNITALENSFVFNDSLTHLWPSTDQIDLHLEVNRKGRRFNYFVVLKAKPDCNVFCV